MMVQFFQTGASKYKLTVITYCKSGQKQSTEANGSAGATNRAEAVNI